ncbi:zinc-ribbon domain-containing protein [Geomonas edaphica]
MTKERDCLRCNAKVADGANVCHVCGADIV